ncbi:MAG: hypothetical protein OXD31_14995 [Chloroflexi bacterium]|nr:hypothetical protein [Chloroflexota bacterium]
MHSILRDDYAKRGLLLDSMIVLTSIIIAALAFFDPSLLNWISIPDQSIKIAIGVLAIIAFFVSVIAWRVDWKAKADAHGRAAAAYTTVKFNLTAIDPELDANELERLLSQYEEISKNSIVIPDSKFLSLKSKHLIKVELSRVLNRSPGACVALIRLKLKLRHSRRSLSRR